MGRYIEPVPLEVQIANLNKVNATLRSALAASESREMKLRDQLSRANRIINAVKLVSHHDDCIYHENNTKCNCYLRDVIDVMQKFPNKT